MNAKQVHYELIMATEKVIKSYRDDLFVHDLSALEDMESRNHHVAPFFHIAYESGTILDFLYPMGDYPYGNSRIPFLFGTVDKFELLESVGNSLRSGQAQHERALVHYYTGNGELQSVSLTEAGEIVAAYKSAMRKRLVEREMGGHE
jgi:hypothetical protein